MSSSIDYSNIKKVTPLFPDVTSAKSEVALRERFKEIEQLKKAKAKKFMEFQALEEELNRLQKEVNIIGQLFKIEYGEINFNEIKNEVTLAIINDTDYRNV